MSKKIGYPVLIIYIAVIYGMFGSVFIYKGFASNINPHIVKTKPILAKIVKINGTIKRGDTISSLLDPYLPLKKIYELSAKKMDGYSLSRIKLGQPYSIITKDKKLIWYGMSMK